MKTVVIEFPDSANIAGIKDVVLRALKDSVSAATGKATSVAVDMNSADQQAGLEKALLQLGITIAAYTPPTGASVDNGDTVAVRNSAGADSHNATAVVSGSTLTGVNLAATAALVDNGDTVTATGTGTTATLVVSDGVVTGVTLA